MGRLQDLYISLLSPFIPFMGKVKDKYKYEILTGCG